MISDTRQQALNDQINKQLFSSYLCLSVAAEFENANLRSFAKWSYMQGDKEQRRSMRVLEHLVNRGGPDDASSCHQDSTTNASANSDGSASTVPSPAPRLR